MEACFGRNQGPSLHEMERKTAIVGRLGERERCFYQPLSGSLIKPIRAKTATAGKAMSSRHVKKQKAWYTVDVLRTVKSKARPKGVNQKGR